MFGSFLSSLSQALRKEGVYHIVRRVITTLAISLIHTTFNNLVGINSENDISV